MHDIVLNVHHELYKQFLKYKRYETVSITSHILGQNCSSPEIIGCASSCVVVRRQQLLQRTSPNLLAGFLPNLASIILKWLSLMIVHMVPVRCIPRSHGPKIDYRDDKYKKIFLSVTSRSRALIFSMKHHLVKLSTRFVQTMPLGPKMPPPWGSNVLHRPI